MAAKTNWRYVQMLVDTFGAEFLVNPPQIHPYPSSLKLEIDRRKLLATLAADDQPYIFPDPDTATRVTILWDHYHERRSFPRSTLRSTLGTGHVYDDDVAHVWAVPRDLGRPPLASEIAEYRTRTLAALDVANSPHVMLLGKAVISMWRNDLGPMAVAGGTFVWGNRWVYPTIHPSAIAMDGQNITTWREGMRGLARAIFDDDIRYGNKCIKCQANADVYDKTAVPYCRGCFNLGNVDRRDKQWEKRTNKAAQPALGL